MEKEISAISDIRKFIEELKNKKINNDFFLLKEKDIKRDTQRQTKNK